MKLKGLFYRVGVLADRTRFAAGNALAAARVYASTPPARKGISVVVVGRNDDYMPDFAGRLHATVAWHLLLLADEVVFVEWNPPPNRPLLAHELARAFPSLRAYVVGAEIHEQLCQSRNLALLEYHAKNVGIRRAASDWILSTNGDAVPGFDIILSLRHRLGSEQTAWTAQRVDVEWRAGRRTPIGLRDFLRYRRVTPYVELGTGEFQLAHRSLWERVRGFDEALVKHRYGCDVRGTAQMVHFGARVSRAGIVLHLAHPTSASEAVGLHHGEWADVDGLPYRNGEDWGLLGTREVPIGERVRRLHPL